MKRWRVETLRQSPGWLVCGAVLAVAPKCLLCILAYAGAGAALGIGGPEICGAASGGPKGWAIALVLLGAALGGIAFRACQRRHRSALEIAALQRSR